MRLGKPLEALRPMALQPLSDGVTCSPEIMHKVQKESPLLPHDRDIVPEKRQGSLHQTSLSVSFQLTEV